MNLLVRKLACSTGHGPLVGIPCSLPRGRRFPGWVPVTEQCDAQGRPLHGTSVRCQGTGKRCRIVVRWVGRCAGRGTSVRCTRMDGLQATSMQCQGDGPSRGTSVRFSGTFQIARAPRLRQISFELRKSPASRTISLRTGISQKSKKRTSNLTSWNAYEPYTSHSNWPSRAHETLRILQVGVWEGLVIRPGPYMNFRALKVHIWARLEPTGFRGGRICRR